MLPLVESSLLEDSSQLHKTPLYSMVSQLLGPAHKCDTIPGAAEFWNHLAGTMLEALDIPTGSGTLAPAEQKHREMLNEKLLAFVRALYYPDLEPKQKSGKVTFKTEEDIDKSLNELTLTNMSEKVNLGQHTAGFVHKLIQHTFNSAHNNKSSSSLQLLSALLDINSDDNTVSSMVQCVAVGARTEGDAEGLSDNITNNDKSNNSTDKCDIIANSESAKQYFVFDICVEWLLRLQKQDSSERDVKNVINIVSLFMNNLDIEKSVQLLEKLNEVGIRQLLQ